MHSKLQELTEKIYQEGVEKGNAEAQQILDNTNSKASEIIEKAKREAESIIKEAKKKAVDTKTNTETEIKLSGKQAINALKQQIVDIINDKITTTAVKGAFDDKNFINKIIETSLSNWASSGQSMDLSLLLPARDEKNLRSFFKKEAKRYLDRGVTIDFDPSLKAGFQLGPKDGSYKVSFTDKDFVNFFKQYLRPKLVEILFSAE
ncbi:V-type proton ATPase subunit E [subsurface metagenome]